MKNPPMIETAAGRVIFIRTPKRLSSSQLTMALNSMADDDPRWLAIHQLIDEELAVAVLDSSSPDLPDTKVRHAGGRTEALATLKQRLMDERSRPIIPAKSGREKSR